VSRLMIDIGPYPIYSLSGHDNSYVRNKTIFSLHHDTFNLCSVIIYTLLQHRLQEGFNNRDEMQKQVGHEVVL